jgi:hypothetical protein
MDSDDASSPNCFDFLSASLAGLFRRRVALTTEYKGVRMTVCQKAASAFRRVCQNSTVLSSGASSEGGAVESRIARLP